MSQSNNSATATTAAATSHLLSTAQCAFNSLSLHLRTPLAKLHLIDVHQSSPSSPSLASSRGLLSDETIVLCTTVLTIITTVLLMWHYILHPITSRIHHSLFAPLHRIVDMETTEQQRKTRRRKRIGDFPPVYPNGWFKVCDSRELRRGQVIQRSICGVEMALFRSESSDEVFAIDLYCTHLGANLAVGGQVKGNCLVCPFHHWAFNGKDGKCVSNGEPPNPMPILNRNGTLKKKIVAGNHQQNNHQQPQQEPQQQNNQQQKKKRRHIDLSSSEASPESSSSSSAESSKKSSCADVGVDECEHNGFRVPSQAHSKKYHIIERNQMIWLWNHAEKEEPSWQIPDVPQHLQHTHGKTEHHVYCHVQEIPENGPDAAHLGVVHEDLEYTKRWVKNIWGATWRAGDANDVNDRHIGHFRVQHVSTFNNWFNIPFSTVDVKGCQLGPGIVMFDFNTPVGMFVMVQTVTPVGPLHQQVEHVIFTPWYLPRFFGKWFMIMMTSAVEQDVPIWNNKTYLKNPVLVKNDGPIAQFRRWYSQFYTENSPTLADLKESSLDW